MNAETIARNAVAGGTELTPAILETVSSARARSILSSSQFVTVASTGRRDVVEAILRSIDSNGLDAGVDEVLELLFNSDRGAGAADWLRTRQSRVDDFVNGGTQSSSGVQPNPDEVGAWYEATVKSPNAEGWDYADRIDDDVVWDPSGTNGQWRPRTRPTPQSVLDARGRVSGLSTSTPSVSKTEVVANVDPSPSSFGSLTNNQLGRGVEQARVAQLRTGPPAAPVVQQARIRVTIPGLDGPIEIRADALTDPVFVDGELRFTYREFKASTVRRPTASSLTNNQALAIDALLNNPDDVVFEVFSGAGSDLGELFEEFGVTTATIDRFVLESYFYP